MGSASPRWLGKERKGGLRVVLLRALHGRVSMLSAIVGRMAAETVRNRKTEQEALSEQAAQIRSYRELKRILATVLLDIFI